MPINFFIADFLVFLQLGILGEAPIAVSELLRDGKGFAGRLHGAWFAIAPTAITIPASFNMRLQSLRPQCD